MWSSLPTAPCSFFDNDHFRAALQMRLGSVRAPDGALCQMVKAGKCSDDKCLTSITNPVVHPLLCKYGPSRLRPHRSMVVRLQQELVRSGANVDIERAVPSLYRVGSDGVVTEAILDVVLSFPGSLTQTSLDVTIRCRHSLRYNKSANVAGTAASDGEMEKFERYGQGVLPIAFETYGRLGSTGQRGL